MNEFNDIELELSRLKPSAPSVNLEPRIEAALAQEITATPTAGVLPQRRIARFNWFAFGVSAAAAAAVAMFAILRFDQPAHTEQSAVAARTSPAAQENRAGTARPEAPTTFVPDGLTRVVYHTRDEGLVYHNKADAPVRRLRSRARETLQWKEPGTGASLRVSYPTEEVELIPVSGQ